MIRRLKTKQIINTHPRMKVPVDDSGAGYITITVSPTDYAVASSDQSLLLLLLLLLPGCGQGSDER